MSLKCWHPVCRGRRWATRRAYSVEHVRTRCTMGDGGTWSSRARALPCCRRAATREPRLGPVARRGAFPRTPSRIVRLGSERPHARLQLQPAEAVCRARRARDPGAGDHARGGGRADLPRFRGGAARHLPGLGQGVRRHGRGGERPSPDADRAVPRAVRRAHPAGPARGRARLPAQEADLADQAAWASTRCGGGRRSSSRRPPTSTARPPSRSRDASIRKLLVDLAEIEVDHANTAHHLEETHLTEIGARERGQDRASRLRPAVRPAGPGRADGRLGLDPGAPVRRRLRHRAAAGTRSWSASPPRSVPASRWASPRRCRTTAASPAAAIPGCAASSAG